MQPKVPESIIHSNSETSSSFSESKLIWSLSQMLLRHSAPHTQSHTRIHSQGQFSVTNPPTGKFLGSGRKQENMEGTHMDSRRPCTETSHRLSQGPWSCTIATHCTIMPIYYLDELKHADYQNKILNSWYVLSEICQSNVNACSIGKAKLSCGHRVLCQMWYNIAETPIES